MLNEKNLVTVFKIVYLSIIAICATSLIIGLLNGDVNTNLLN